MVYHCVCAGCTNSSLSGHRVHSFPNRKRTGASFRSWVRCARCIHLPAAHTLHSWGLSNKTFIRKPDLKCHDWFDLNSRTEIPGCCKTYNYKNVFIGHTEVKRNILFSFHFIFVLCVSTVTCLHALMFKQLFSCSHTAQMTWERVQQP